MRLWVWTSSPTAMERIASLCPAGMSEDAVRRRPLSDWPAASGLRATTTSSEVPSMRVWCIGGSLSPRKSDELRWPDLSIGTTTLYSKSPTNDSSSSSPGYQVQSLLSYGDRPGPSGQSLRRVGFIRKALDSGYLCSFTARMARWVAAPLSSFASLI